MEKQKRIRKHSQYTPHTIKMYDRLIKEGSIHIMETTKGETQVLNKLRLYGFASPVWSITRDASGNPLPLEDPSRIIKKSTHTPATQRIYERLLKEGSIHINNPTRGEAQVLHCLYRYGFASLVWRLNCDVRGNPLPLKYPA